MKVLGWLLFLPVGFVLFSLAQLATGIAAENLGWWAVPLVFFFGILNAVVGMAPVKMTSKPVIAAAIFLTLFLTFEIVALYSQFSGMSIPERIVRILCDGQLIVGVIVGANAPKEPSV